MSLERCCIMVACRRKRLASKCLLHRWCNTLGFQGLRDVTGEMLHHGGMLKEGLVSICCIRVNVATNGYKPCQWDRAQFWGGRIVMVASWVTVATVLQQTMHKRRGREGDYNSRKCCIKTTALPVGPNTWVFSGTPKSWGISNSTLMPNFCWTKDTANFVYWLPDSSESWVTMKDIW